LQQKHRPVRFPQQFSLFLQVNGSADLKSPLLHKLHQAYSSSPHGLVLNQILKPHHPNLIMDQRFPPIVTSSGKTKIPSATSFGTYFSSIPNSCREQIIPFDSTPRNFTFFILKFPGKTAPGLATATF